MSAAPSAIAPYAKGSAVCWWSIVSRPSTPFSTIAAATRRPPPAGRRRGLEIVFGDRPRGIARYGHDDGSIAHVALRIEG